MDHFHVAWSKHPDGYADATFVFETDEMVWVIHPVALFLEKHFGLLPQRRRVRLVVADALVAYQHFLVYGDIEGQGPALDFCAFIEEGNRLLPEVVEAVEHFLATFSGSEKERETAILPALF